MLHGGGAMGMNGMGMMGTMGGGSFLYPTLIHDPEQRVLNSLRVRQASKRLVAAKVNEGLGVKETNDQNKEEAEQQQQQQQMHALLQQQ